MSRFAGLPFLFLLGALSCWAILADRSGASSPNVPSAAAAVVGTDEATLTPTLDVASPTLTASSTAATDTATPTATSTSTPEPTATPAPPTSPYTVQPGDTLASLAGRLNIPEADRAMWIQNVLEVNSLADANHVEVGQSLVLPSLDDAIASATAEALTPTSTPTPIETPTATDTPTPEATATPAAAATPAVQKLEPVSVAQTYVVQPGDTLSTIADSLGISPANQDTWTQQVLQQNGIADANHVEVGQTLTLPGGANASAGSTRTTTPAPESTTQAVSDVSAATTSALNGAAAPTITGKSAAVIDGDCGALVYGDNAHERLAPASLTKIITAIVTMQHAGLDDQITADVSATAMAQQDYSVMGLEPGMKVSVKDLLYGLLLPSGNDAAETLASYVGGGSVSAFVGLMNQEATQLGLKDTHFANPSGLDDPNLYSSTYDMAEAGMALLANPTLARIVDTISYMPDSPDWTNGALTNDNQLLATYPGAYGVKIGYEDNAQQTIVAAAEQNGRHLILSVFGSSDRYGDAAALFDWAFANLPQTCH